MARLNKDERAILAALAKLGGQRVQDDALVYRGEEFVIPSNYEGKPISAVIKFLEDYQSSQEKAFEITRTFDFHPYDVANAFQRVLKTVFGTTGFGVDKVTFFGTTLPEYKTVAVGLHETVQVPWDLVELPLLDARFEIGYAFDRNQQPVGEISVAAPKKYRGQVEGLFRAIDADLRDFSLYRGKAFDANWMDPEFINVFTVDENRVSYSADTEAQLEANVWSVIEHLDKLRELNMPSKRTVLLEGPFGTGKSLTGMLTGQKALKAGWTFVYARPDQDLGQALHAARLYAPAVVFFEDLDTIGGPGSGDQDRVSRILDMFDGITTKGAEGLIAVLTTNHVEKLHKGMLRPGRLDAVIRIDKLDHNALAKLVKALVPEHLYGDIDLDEVADSLDGFLPAFVKETVDRALRYQVARTGGQPGQINTADLVHAANGLRPQLELMTGAKEQTERPDLERAIRATLAGLPIYHKSDPEGKEGAKPTLRIAVSE